MTMIRHRPMLIYNGNHLAIVQRSVLMLRNFWQMRHQYFNNTFVEGDIVAWHGIIRFMLCTTNWTRLEYIRKLRRKAMAFGQTGENKYSDRKPRLRGSKPARRVGGVL